jgi:two-component system chemotaxis response regulator CheY
MKSQILIIDDDDAMCLLLEKLLHKSYAVTTKKNGMEAMYWLVGGRIPDLIITDLDMPNLDGVEFLKNLKKSGFYKDVPVIVITGYHDKEQKMECMKHGAYEFFIKPFNPKDLLFSVDVVLKHSKKKMKLI